MPTDRAGISGQSFAESGRYGATDTSVTVKAAPGANRRLVITKATFEVYTTAAQVVTLGDGTILRSFSGNSVGPHLLDFGPFGLKFTDNTAVTLTTPSAGPAFTYAISGYVEGAWL